MSTYAIFMIVGVLVVGAGWIAYYLWNRKMDKEEASQPKPQTAQMKKTKSEVSDWAKKMAEFKGPPQRPTGGPKSQGS
jgi:hypothetical protein